MKLTATLSHSLAKAMTDYARKQERTWPAAVQQATKRVKARSRSHVIGAGLGRRLGNTVRDKFYPNQGNDPAGLVYSKAPEILYAFEYGVTIRSKNGFWLAIPTATAPKKVMGRKVTPGRLEQAWGIRLRFVYRRGRSALLVADGMRARRGKRGGYMKARVRRTKTRGDYVSLQGLTTVPLFVLVPQVKMPDRIDLVRHWPRWADEELGQALEERGG